MTAWRATLSLLAAVHGIGTRTAAGQVPAVRDSAGWQIVSHPGADIPLAWTLVEVWRAGGAADDRLQLTGLRAEQLAVTNDGGLLLLDTAERRILVFSPTGVLSHTVGRRGGGPGEMLNPQGIDLADDQSIWVADPSKGTFVRWTANGTPAGETRLPGSFVQRVRWTPRGVVSTVRQDTGQSRGGRNLVRMGAAEAEILARHRPDVLYTNGRYPSCPGYGVGAPPWFVPELIWDALEGNVATARGPEYSIQLTRQGQPPRMLRRDLTPLVLDAESAAASLDQDFVIPQLNCTITRQELVRVRGFRNPRPIITDLTLGPDGELWVTRRAPGTRGYLVDVFSSDGNYLGTLPPTSPLPARIRGNYLVSVATDEADVPVVVVYRIRRS